MGSCGLWMTRSRAERNRSRGSPLSWSSARVDVVLLDEAPDLLRQRVLETGRLLICRDPVAFRDLRVRTMREYGDREWVRELMLAAQKRRLEQGEPSGRSARALESLGRVGRLPR